MVRRWLLIGYFPILDYPSGLTLALAVDQDCFGDSNHLVRAAAFAQLGGFNGAPLAGAEDSTGEDWELFARATLQGFHLQVRDIQLNSAGRLQRRSARGGGGLHGRGLGALRPRHAARLPSAGERYPTQLEKLQAG
jgi:hypothetical protein